jgi:hypothetical protein
MKEAAIDFQEWSERFGMIKKKSLYVSYVPNQVCKRRIIKQFISSFLIKVSKNMDIFLEKSTPKKCYQVMMTFVLDGSILVAVGFYLSKIIAQHGKPVTGIILTNHG